MVLNIGNIHRMIIRHAIQTEKVLSLYIETEVIKMANRNLDVVIQQILRLVPETETAFLADIADVRSSLAYTSPESMGLRWRQMADCLEDNFPVDEANFLDWHKQIINLWTTEDIFPEVIDAN